MPFRYPWIAFGCGKAHTTAIITARPGALFMAAFIMMLAARRAPP